MTILVDPSQLAASSSLYLANVQSITTTITISGTSNAHSIGNITLVTTASLTLSTNCTWRII